MKKVGDLMKEIGFNPNGSDAVKEAFIKHLIKASTGVNVQTPSEKKEIFENPQKIVSLKPPVQMAFDFDGDDSNSKIESTKKKVV